MARLAVVAQHLRRVVLCGQSFSSTSPTLPCVRQFDDSSARRAAFVRRVTVCQFTNKMTRFNQITASRCWRRLLILPPAPLLAKTRKGDKLRNEARDEEAEGQLRPCA